MFSRSRVINQKRANHLDPSHKIDHQSKIGPAHLSEILHPRVPVSVGLCVLCSLSFSLGGALFFVG